MGATFVVDAIEASSVIRAIMKEISAADASKNIDATDSAAAQIETPSTGDRFQASPGASASVDDALQTDAAIRPRNAL